MLRRLARFSLRHRRLVAAAWAALFIVGIAIGTGVFDRLDPDVGDVEGTESARVQARLHALDPGGETITAVADGVDPRGPQVAAETELRWLDAPHVLVGGGPLQDQEFEDQVAYDLGRPSCCPCRWCWCCWWSSPALVAAGLPVLIALVGAAGALLALFGISLLAAITLLPALLAIGGVGCPQP